MAIFDDLQYDYRPSWSPAVRTMAILFGPFMCQMPTANSACSPVSDLRGSVWRP